MVAAVAGGLAAGLAGGVLNKAFGPKFPKSPQLGGLTSPGVDLTRTGSNIDVTRGLGVAQPLGQLQALAQGQAGALGNLLGRVQPGASELRASRLAGLESTRRRVIGDLRENLARRRISGSSFASDALSRAESEFEQQADRIRAESTLAELDLTNKLLTQQYQTLVGSVTTALQQANVESNLGANFANGVQANLTSIFNTQAQLAAQASTGLGKFFEPALSSIQSGVAGLFKPSATTPTAPASFGGGFSLAG